MAGIRTTLHIGGEKTGTTSIQSFLSSNRSVLRESGILFPTSLGSANHELLAIFASPTAGTEDLKALLGLNSGHALDSLRSSLPSTLLREVSESGCSEVVISNEHCSSRLTEETAVQRVRQILETFSTATRIMIYLRRQDELLLSAYSTSVKAGETRPLRIPERNGLIYYDYLKILNLWAKVFGQSNIIVKIYHEDTLFRGDIIDDFIQTMGFSNLPKTLPRPQLRLNRSLDLTTLEFLRVFNSHIPPILAGRVNPGRSNIVEVLERLSGDSRSCFDSKELARFFALFTPSNSEVARRFLGRADGRLFPESKNDPGQPPPSLDLAEAIRLAAELWAYRHRNS
ncbi:MAG TPA: hypothetical protein VM755_09880 [Stellaceae bacterium]|nr:hypothetical protein [Stellaceae bacterium]